MGHAKSHAGLGLERTPARTPPQAILQRSGLDGRSALGIGQLKYPEEPLDARNRRVSIVVQIPGMEAQ